MTVPRNEDIRVALVGCGAIARSHARAVTATAGARCAALFDVNRARAEAFGKAFAPGAEVVDELGRVADCADLAIVAVPNAHHAAVTTDLLRRGMHVLCEKPLAGSLAEAREMVSVAESEGCILVCGLVRRFFGSTALVAEALRREVAGRP